MAEPDEHPETCGECRFWLHTGEESGFCRVHAPRPGHRENEVGQWPLTHVTEVCGEGEQGTAQGAVFCHTCRFWHKPGRGIQPVAAYGRGADWWQDAGYCRRYAPLPSVELGARTFWRTTHAQEFCFEGLPLAGSAPS